VIEAAEDGGAGIVVVDIDCDLGPRCVEVLRRCDQVMITLTPTAGGLVDAYRSTAVLRRMGLRERIGYVVNRWHPGIDIGETMADLAGTIAAEVPDDRSVVEAENSHRIAGLDGTGAVPAALTKLAEVIESVAGVQLSPITGSGEVVVVEGMRSTAHQTGRG
jgi:MinD superfamily P-loop ATPase